MIDNYLANLLRNGEIPGVTFRQEKIEEKVSVFYEEKELGFDPVKIATKIDENNQTMEINIRNIFKIDEEAEFSADYDRYDLVNGLNSLSGATGKMYVEKNIIHLKYTIPYGAFATFDPYDIQVWHNLSLHFRNHAISSREIYYLDEHNILIPI